MLKLYEFNDTDASDCLAVLNLSGNVKITRELNGAYSLDFTYPQDEKAKLLRVNRLICCEGQLFRILKTSRASDGKTQWEVECSHVYNADAQAVHLQNVPDFIGKSPYEVLQYAFKNTPFTLLGDTELKELGLTRMDADGFLMDFFSMDKTTPYEVVNTVIENCGKGEIYVDNYKIALVERIGADSNVRLEISRNLQNVTVERDMTDLITRLYPYGYEDLHIGSVNNDVQYLDSPNIAIYGIREGFKDYSDYKEPSEVLNRGLWEFDAENEERIDVPSVNISGKLIDLSKLAEYGDFMQLHLGDKVTIIDGDTKISERIIRMEQYPYEPLLGEVSVGRVKKDLFFYLNQMGKLNRRYSRVSTSSGKISAGAIAGVVSADGVNVKDSSGNVSVLTDKISMSDANGTRFLCGFSGNTFQFAVYDKNGRALYLSEDVMQLRGDVSADSLKINGVAVSGKNGELYIGNKKILTGT